ncbi:ACN9-domain-containing protein [Venturia nashicola]|uniref:Succinate dehydrogenase assembly factor 3 n=1 Tax=Venturia nashicola TaxID=86259 RepID=A0A4Z1NT96_9PEZI|nr:ACN9-domain-containing protein [Venturia nashicola]TLD19999.1 ACN9-domain-containing protein [Venturia nashicola]
MRVFSRLLATTSAGPGRHVPLSLLPPIPLYRRLLRAQRKLPGELRVLGDQYIKSEFRAHRDVENPLHIVGFLTQWQLFAQKIEGAAWNEDAIDQATFEKMSDDQKVQLYELMTAIRKKDLEENDPEYTPDK